MFVKIIKPSEELSRYIKYYWILEIDAKEGAVSERVIPTGDIELMFHYKNPFIKKTGIITKQPKSFISGISSHYTDVATSGDSGVIAVTFHPFGACNFFRFPLQNIENLSVHLGDMEGREVILIEEQISEARSVYERIRIIERYLFTRLQPVSSDDMWFIQECIKIIYQNKGCINAAQLSDKLYISGKSLERKFSSLIGKTPKQYIRIIRFQEAIRSLHTPGSKSMTELAYENGYFDQAHFIKDFKALSGYTPKEFLINCERNRCHKTDLNNYEK